MLNVPIISNLVTSLGKYLQKGSIKESDIAVIKPQLDFLMHLFPLPKYPCMPAQLERLTINRKVPLYTDDRIDKLEYIKYPDESYVKTYGRCNIIGQPVLYGGFNLLTIIKEMQPETGITITHSQWKLKEEKPLNMFPIFFITQYQDQPHNSLSIDIKELHYAYTKKFSEHDKRGFDLAMEFFAKCFAKEIDETNHFDYFISAYISKKIFHLIKYMILCFTSQ